MGFSLLDLRLLMMIHLVFSYYVLWECFCISLLLIYVLLLDIFNLKAENNWHWRFFLMWRKPQIFLDILCEAITVHIYNAFAKSVNFFVIWWCFNTFYRQYIQWFIYIIVICSRSTTKFFDNRSCTLSSDNFVGLMNAWQTV